MILQKEFYFIRHGQTDHHKGLDLDNTDIPLNVAGEHQARNIEPLIATLPIQTICFSPLIRAKQTKDLIASSISVKHHELEDLKECCWNTWNDMTSQGQKSKIEFTGSVKEFMYRAVQGINQALSLPGPVLIVAHGGVHWAMCYFMDVDCNWAIDHCVPVHYSLDGQGQWVAKNCSKSKL